MKIYVVRHGETEVNKKEILAGRTDVPMNEEGIKQVRDLSNRLPSGIDKIYCSPLLRTKQTAEILNQRLNVPIEVRDELIERDYGSKTGLPHEGNQHYRKYNSDLSPFGGESYEDMRSRVENMFDHIKKHDADKTVLLVTSRIVMKVMNNIVNAELDMAPANGGIYEFEL